MNSEAKRLWLEALRSGNYLQGAGCLLGPDGKFCCLGVLTDLYAKVFGYQWNFDAEGNADFAGQDAILPVEVAAWAGINQCQRVQLDAVWPHLPTLAEINDGYFDLDYDFNAIAEVVEVQL